MEFKEGDILEIVKKGGRQYAFILNNSTEEILIEEIEKDLVEKSLVNKNNLIFVNGKFIENVNKEIIKNKIATMGNNDILVEIEKIANDIPDDIIISRVKWSILTRNILRCENTMLIGPTGTGKTTIVYALAEKMGRKFFKFPLGASQDPKTMLIGTTEFIEGVGTKFIPSEFVEAIQTPNAVILLDEFTRINYEAENILFTVLDHQRYLKIDEGGGRTIKVADGVTFVATANIGSAYTATRVIDRASRDRFTTIELPFLTALEEFNHLQRLFPNVSEYDLNSLTRITAVIRDDFRKGGDVYGGELISSRHAINIMSAVADGLDLKDVLQETALPLFENDGGNETPYIRFKALIDSEITNARNNPKGSKPSKPNVFKPKPRI